MSFFNASKALITCFTLSLITSSALAKGRMPAHFDLREVDGKSYVTSVKKQEGGTCWTHGTVAAIESNLAMNGAWAATEEGEPALAEYHLDWWNGFNQHFNSDIAPATAGLVVHEGGDYRVAAAYLSRGGAVRKKDAQSFETAPSQSEESFHHFYVRDIVWLATGNEIQNREKMKEALMQHGVVGTALAWDEDFYDENNHTFYQPPTNQEDPNHAVAIVGWDDNKVTEAPEKGAWLVKNSWGEKWGEKGYFWISYYDKVAGHHPQMGAVSFQNAENLQYSHIYSHDYHGWRDTKAATQGFNAFVAKQKEKISEVSFYTTEDNARYRVQIYKKFEDNTLSELVSVTEGAIQQTGFHTIKLDWPVYVDKGENFYVELTVNKGGLAYDKTSDVPVLLGGGQRTLVTSTASAGESYYLAGKQWVDLHGENASANFCIKALAENRPH